MPGLLFDTSVWIAAIFDTHPCHQAAQGAMLKAIPAVANVDHGPAAGPHCGLCLARGAPR